ncbi:iron ABC transporter permease [Lysinibacillus sp. HST-98]|uniref:ABC transporter permease n=1 Tax=Lysinibacillus sp. HST-98 TaxID=2800419 RepID=UPI001927A8E7|nr:iron ABC transporter permease [Lysinibacillus sp. HST-98]MBL3732185.1 iron ABC transporter permease [Lysinibacillus sp. HST-98]
MQAFSIRFNKVKILNILIYLFIFWFVIAFLFYPNIQMVFSTFKTESGFSLDIINKLLESPIAMNSLKNSFILAVSLAITTNIVGIFIVLVTEYFEIKGSKILKIGYMTTFIYGGIILVSGYLMIYGENGIITSFFMRFFPNLDPTWFEGFWAVLFVMTVSTTTQHMMFLSSAVKSIDNFTVEAAKQMGASPFYTIRRVVLPIVMPTVFAITILQFLGGLSAFAAPLMLGGRDFQTIAPLILQLNKIPASQGLALILSLILGLAAVTLLVFFTRLEKGGTYFSISKTKAGYVKQKIQNKFLNIIVHIAAYILFLVYIFPVVLIVIFSFTDAEAIHNVQFSLSSFTLDNYRMVFSDFEKIIPFLNSVEFSIIAAICVTIIVLIGISLSRKYNNWLTNIIEYAFLIPWMLPSTLIAIGLLITYATPQLIIGNQVLIGSNVLLILAYIIILIPLTSRLLRAAYQTVDNDFENAAKSLGASSFYTFRRVVLPILLPTILALLVLNFNSLLSDYNLAAFLSHPLKEPLGLLIQRNTMSEAVGDTQALVYVYSTLLMAIAAVTVSIVYGWLLKDKK